jgi:hypothetical protein
MSILYDCGEPVEQFQTVGGLPFAAIMSNRFQTTLSFLHLLSREFNGIERFITDSTCDPSMTKCEPRFMSGPKSESSGFIGTSTSHLLISISISVLSDNISSIFGYCGRHTYHVRQKRGLARWLTRGRRRETKQQEAQGAVVLRVSRAQDEM